MSDSDNPARTALGRLLTELWRRTSSAWNESPRSVRRKFVVTLGVGFVLLFGLEAAFALWGEATYGSRTPDWDEQASRWFYALSVEKSAVRWLDVWGNALVTWPIALLAAGHAGWKRLPFRAVGMLGGYAATEVFVLGGWALWSRPRPHFGDGADIGWHSFPSGHAVHIVFLAGILCWAWAAATTHTLEKLVAGAVFAGVTLLVSFVRLRMAVHWPLDVAVGLAIGALWLVTVVGAIAAAERRSTAP